MDENKEVAVFGAIRVEAPIARYVDLVTEIENFEQGAGFRITRRISVPPTLSDFAELRLPPEDIEELPSCRIGDCRLQLSEHSLRRFRTEVKWEAPGAEEAANALFRRIALEYVTAYLQGGNERLAVRGSRRGTRGATPASTTRR